MNFMPEWKTAWLTLSEILVVVIIFFCIAKSCPQSMLLIHGWMTEKCPGLAWAAWEAPAAMNCYKLLTLIFYLPKTFQI